MKKFLFTLLFSVLSLSLVSCEKPAEEAESEPITFDWYINYSWFVTGWGGNVVSDKITEETGVSVNFLAPVGNEAEKLNAMIASDSLPDIITMGWWEPQFSEIIEKGMVYPLNELADEYDPGFYDVANDIVLKWYTTDDGNIYCYPNSSYTREDLIEHDNIPSNQTFLVRKDIYEAIGSPDMTTPEGFHDAVVKAAKMFPEVGGESLIPIGAHMFDDSGCVSFDQYLQNFLAIPFEKDGEFYDRNTDPEYITWLKMFRDLQEEGYLNADLFVDTRTQMSEKIERGRYFCMIYQRTDLADQEKLLYARDPEKIYIAVDGPKNSRGDDPVLPSTGITGWTVTMISKNCKDPERAIKFMDYLMSEHGQKIICLGVEGVTYTEEDGIITIVPEVKEILNRNREEYDALYAADDTYWMLQNNVMQLQWKSEAEEPLKQLAEWTYPYTTYLGQYEFIMSQNTEAGVISEKVDKLWSETLKDLLLASSEEEFDEILSNYIKERDALGFDKVAREKTRQIKENKRKLGIE